MIDALCGHRGTRDSTTPIGLDLMYSPIGTVPTPAPAPPKAAELEDQFITDLSPEEGNDFSLLLDSLSHKTVGAHVF
ncbi:hypothetical protein [Anoxynatronum sibiricum]|uniref:hypothetical protein n=1 Tax=Anoxynatronum sibiricum TaxID=210623 RepID=UPI0031B86C86